MKSRTLFAIASLAIATVGTVGFLYAKGPRPQSGNFGKVARADLVQRVTIAGTVDPEKSAVIAAPYDAYVRKLHVKIGQTVRPGDPLVTVAQTLSGNDMVYPIRASFKGTVVQVLKKEGQFV